MIKYIFRQNKDYSRFNIIKQFTGDLKLKNDIYILLPFSKNQFFKNFFKRDQIINDFFISNFDTYVYDRKKITAKNTNIPEEFGILKKKLSDFFSTKVQMNCTAKGKGKISINAQRTSCTFS